MQGRTRVVMGSPRAHICACARAAMGLSLAHTPSAACLLPGAHAHMRAAACFPRGALSVFLLFLHDERPSTARTSSGAHARTYAAA